MKRFVTVLTGFALSCAMSLSMFAQSYEVKGSVVDAIGPVIGATVMEQGTMNGTITGTEGDFILKVSGPEAVVVVSCVGYQTVSYQASKLPATISLEDDATLLEDVVVIG